MVCALLTPCAVRTRTWTLVPVMSNGNWALICSAETKNSGATSVLDPSITSTETPSRLAGSGTLVAALVPDARFLPKIEKMIPGAKLAV